jgi:hypothetical protein
MSRRDELDPEWQAVIMSMREGETAQAWLKSGNDTYRVYEVHLARVDRLDSAGRALPEIHDHLCTSK